MSPNRLADETSPYLRQHADNPVDWYPVGRRGLRAGPAPRTSPIFLSIGYSACHWCHVMAHESFEDPATAAELNASFVAVKVDREERPDVDAVYMEAVQAITGSGGWPMSMFLTPDRTTVLRRDLLPARSTGAAPRRSAPCWPPSPTCGSTAVTRWRARPTSCPTPSAPGRSFLARATGHPRSGPGMAGGDGDGDPTCSGRRPGSWPAGSTPSGADSAERPSSPNPPWWTWPCCHARATRPNPTAGGHWRWPRSPSTPWPPVASTTTWAGGSPATRPTSEWLVPHFEKMLYDQAGLLRAYPARLAGHRPGGLPPGHRGHRGYVGAT